MTEFLLPYVSVSSAGGEYFQVSFTENEASDAAYFLIQRQFESYDGGLSYIESHQRTLCGHFKIGKAELRRELFRLELICQPPETVQIRFHADETRYKELKIVLKAILPSGVLKIQ
jgi:hypothetical protein